jgi:hypothetical protein
MEPLEVELFEEEESDSITPCGEPKHWHIFHVVARRPEQTRVAQPPGRAAGV